MVKPFSTEIEPETAIIVGVVLPNQTELQVKEYLDRRKTCDVIIFGRGGGYRRQDFFFTKVAASFVKDVHRCGQDCRNPSIS